MLPLARQVHIFLEDLHFRRLNVLLSLSVSVADPRGTPGDPLWTKIFLISCSFWKNLANLYVGAPRRLVPHPTGNPGSAPDHS